MTKQASCGGSPPSACTIMHLSYSLHVNRLLQNKVPSQTLELEPLRCCCCCCHLELHCSCIQHTAICFGNPLLHEPNFTLLLVRSPARTALTFLEAFFQVWTSGRGVLGHLLLLGQLRRVAQGVYCMLLLLPDCTDVKHVIPANESIAILVFQLPIYILFCLFHCYVHVAI